MATVIRVKTEDLPPGAIHQGREWPNGFEEEKTIDLIESNAVVYIVRTNHLNGDMYEEWSDDYYTTQA